MLEHPPYRLCCGQQHWGPQCPDGLVMCCLCFSRFTIDELNETGNGPEDVCKLCAQHEREVMARRHYFRS